MGTNQILRGFSVLDKLFSINKGKLVPDPIFKYPIINPKSLNLDLSNKIIH
jgi:hypothetical protein